MVDKRNAYRILLEKSLINCLPGRVLRTWESNVLVDTEETGCEAVKFNVSEDCSKGKNWY